jgi:tRNA pseudouridine55 synthase
VNGALLVDKPAGVTSHDVVAIARRALGTRSVGHTGTLDPFATGLLVLLIGKATRLARFLDGFEKVYTATVRLGQGSDTDDGTGELTALSAIGYPLSEDRIRSALTEFVGTQLQMPPAFSAKKVDGQRAYARARKGEEVVLKQVEVTIHSLELLKYEWPDVELRASVSTGTYIRSLARDLGKKLGTEAHCAALRRERIGAFDVRNARTLEELQAAAPEHRIADSGMLSMLELVPHLAAQELSEADVAHIRHGRKVATALTAGPIALVQGKELLAIAEVAEGMAQPTVVFAE